MSHATPAFSLPQRRKGRSNHKSGRLKTLLIATAAQQGFSTPFEGLTRVKLALVTETYPPEVNGVAMTLNRLVAGLAARGHEVEVVRPRQRAEARGQKPEARGQKPEARGQKSEIRCQASGLETK